MMNKKFYVGICMPYPGLRKMWDVKENIDTLCPDMMGKVRGIDTPILIINAKNEEEAVKEYKTRVPETKNWKLWHGWKPA